MKKILLLSLFLVSLCSCADLCYRQVEIRRYNDHVDSYVDNKLMASYTGHILDQYTGRDNKTVIIMYVDHNKNYTEIRFPYNATVVITKGDKQFRSVKGPKPFPGTHYELID